TADRDDRDAARGRDRDRPGHRDAGGRGAAGGAGGLRRRGRPHPDGEHALECAGRGLGPCARPRRDGRRGGGGRGWPRRRGAGPGGRRRPARDGGVTTARARSRPLVPPTALLAMAIGGAAVAAIALAATALPVPAVIHLPPPARALLVASVVMLALAVCLLPHRLGRMELLAIGLAALGAQAALAAVADPPAVAALLVLIGMG